ncbi:MAG: pitrilysin family protein [Gemmatimonadota bacterium]|jgi:zinc protease
MTIHPAPCLRHRPTRACARVARFVLAVALAGIAPLSAQSPHTVRDTVLENGLQVIVLPSHAIPVATIEVVVRAGAFTQIDAQDEGVPHILEHMLFKAYDGGRGFRGEAGDLGAAYNGTTSDERVTYFVTLASDRVEDGIDALGKLVDDPDFSQRDLDGELQVVRGELERMVSDPYQVLDIISNRVLWGTAFQRKNAIGNMITILSAERDRVRDHYRKYYIPNNSALIVTGDVEPEQVFEWADDNFDGWDERDDPFEDFTPIAVSPLEKDTTFVVDTPSTDVTISVKWQGPSLGEDPVGALAADVFSQMFNQINSGAQGRLVDTGVFQLVTMGYRTLQNVGPVSMRARTTPEQIVRALTELGVELALFSDPTYFDEDDLEAAKRALRFESAVRREVAATAAHSLADMWAIGGLDYYRTYEQGLQEITLEDVRAYVDRYLVGQPRVISAMATEELIAPLSTALGQIVAQWPRVFR